MYQLIIQEEVTEDMTGACNWYEIQRAGLGDELMDEITESV